MTHAPILNVAVNVPLSRLFDYLAPDRQECPAVGTRVLVPFGRRDVVGLVMGVSDRSDVAGTRLKRAQRALETEPLLSDEALWLISFTSDYYHHPIGEVAAAALPVLLRKGKNLDPLIEYVAITDAIKA